MGQSFLHFLGFYFLQPAERDLFEAAHQQRFCCSTATERAALLSLLFAPNAVPFLIFSGLDWTPQSLRLIYMRVFLNCPQELLLQHLTPRPGSYTIEPATFTIASQATRCICCTEEFSTFQGSYEQRILTVSQRQVRRV